MSNKSNQAPAVKQLKASLVSDLFELSSKLDAKDRMQIALNLDVSAKTVDRYLSGDEKEIRRLELAEALLREAKTTIKKAATVTM